MLSRVAERLYWLGRYLERIECTARLVAVYGNVIIDMPRPAKLVWESLLAITGSTENFNERYSRADERNVVKFLLADKNYPGSLVTAVTLARENARTAREIVPTQSWQGINDLYLYIGGKINAAFARVGRDDVLNEIIEHVQLIVGTLEGTMSRDAPYQFLCAGRYLERADMASRVVDVGVATVFPWVTHSGGQEQDGTRAAFESVQWMSVLRSLSALQMYRRLVPERVRPHEVAEFLIKDQDFPRAVACSLRSLDGCFSQLPNHKAAHAAVHAARKRLRNAKLRELLAAGELYAFVDDMQVEFNRIHDVICDTWFLPPPDAAAGQPA